MGDTLEKLSRTGEVEMNLVVSSVGLPAAKILREKFGTPYVIGTPISGFTEELIQIMNKKSHMKQKAEMRKRIMIRQRILQIV